MIQESEKYLTTAKSNLCLSVSVWPSVVNILDGLKVAKYFLGFGQTRQAIYIIPRSPEMDQS